MVRRTFFQQVAHRMKDHLDRHRFTHALLTIAMLPVLYMYTKQAFFPDVQYTEVTSSEISLQAPITYTEPTCPDDLSRALTRARRFMDTTYPMVEYLPDDATDLEAEAAYWGYTDISHVLLEVGNFANRIIADMKEENSTWTGWSDCGLERVGYYLFDYRLNVRDRESLMNRMMRSEISAERVRRSQPPDSRIEWKGSELGRRMEDAVHALDVQHRLASIAATRDVMACPEAMKLLRKAKLINSFALNTTILTGTEAVQRGQSSGLFLGSSVPCIAQAAKDLSRAIHIGQFKRRVEGLSGEFARVQRARLDYYNSVEDWIENWRPCSKFNGDDLSWVPNHNPHCIADVSKG